MSVVDGAVLPPREAQQHRREGWRLAWPGWLPKTVLVTFGLTLLSAWLFPALTHQWQDRQRARELSAGLVARISKQTSQTLVTSDFFSGGRAPFVHAHRFDQRLFNQLDLEWRDASAEIAAQLQAYYSPAVLGRWRTYSRLVQKTYFLATPDTYRRVATIETLHDHFGTTHWREWRGDLLRKPWVGRAGSFPRIRAYLKLSGAILAESSAISDAVLRDHPAGFSTRPSDIIHDLLP